MPTIKTQTTTEEETEVTSDYCYSKAAELLANQGRYATADLLAAAAEWRLLGDSLAR